MTDKSISRKSNSKSESTGLKSKSQKTGLESNSSPILDSSTTSLLLGDHNIWKHKYVIEIFAA